MYTPYLRSSVGVKYISCDTLTNLGECHRGFGTNLAIRVHGWRRRSRRLLLLLEVVAAAPVDVGAEEPAAVLIVVRVRRERRSHPETAVEVLSVLQIIKTTFNCGFSALRWIICSKVMIAKIKAFKISQCSLV